MDQRRITPVTTAGSFAAVMLILALLSTYVPFFSIVGYFIMPIPVAIIYMKFGARWAIMMALVVGVLMGIFINPAVAVIQLIAFGGVGMALGAGFRHDWSPAKMLTGVTAALGLTFVIAAVLMFVFMDFNLWQVLMDQLQTIPEAVISSYEESGMSEVQLRQAKSDLEQLMQMLPTMIPLMTCLALSIISYLNIKIAQMMLTRLGYAVRPFLPIRYWEISRSMLYLYVLAMVMKYWGMTRNIDGLNIVGLNLEQLSLFFISIQGIAFVLYLLDRRFKIGTVAQVFIVIVLLILPIFQYFVFIAGIFDMISNYRKKRSAA